jgi:hypothetical protein
MFRKYSRSSRILIALLAIRWNKWCIGAFKPDLMREYHFYFVGALLVGTISAVWSQSTAPATQPAEAPWTLYISHPSLNRQGFYNCILTIPEKQAFNDFLGVALLLVDRDGHELGSVPLLSQGIMDGNRIFQCSLGPALIKKSTLSFQLNPNTDSVRWVKLTLGDHKTFRRVGEKMIEEPIE